MVRLRPAGGGDVAAMQSLFHRMSSEDVYMRFFRKVSALSYDEAQRLCNVDFDHDVAFVAVKGSRENEEIIGIAGYFLNPSTNLAEIAFMVEPAHQKSGLGTAMQDRLSEFARARKVRGFVAEVLQVNEGMMGLARRLGEVEIHTRRRRPHRDLHLWRSRSADSRRPPKPRQSPRRRQRSLASDDQSAAPPWP